MRKHNKFLYLTVLALWNLAPMCIAQEEDAVSGTLGWYGKALDGTPCDGSLSAYGPYDYTNPEHRRCCLKIVEDNHFNIEVEQLKKGITAISPAGDLDYTLRAFPNHPRALLAMIRLQLMNTIEPTSSLTPPECYLQRAEVFSPNDANIPFLHGFYLHRKGLYEDALKQYLKAETIYPEFPALHYYIAKLYLKLGEKEKAAQHGERASSLGISRNAFDSHKNE